VRDALPKAKAMLGDRGHDADSSRTALIARGIEPCIPPRTRRKVQIDYDKALYRQRHRIESMFARLKDWRRNHTR
jgi:transposase